MAGSGHPSFPFSVKLRRFLVMQDVSLLRDLVILIAFAIPTVAGAQRIRVSPIVAFLVTGMIIGPYGLGLIEGSSEVAALAEIGVVLLLFEIGLEIPLVQIVRMRATMLLGGTLQVTLTVLAGAAIGTLAGVPLPNAITFGCLLSLSSTAIVLKTLRDENDLDAPHGRVAVGILVFQDLAIVVLILLVQILGGSDSDLSRTLIQAAIGLLALGSLVLIGRRFVPFALRRIVDLHNPDLFTLTIGLFGLGAAFITASLGLSLALGAFLAGAIISESEYGAQALSDVLPFRALFSSIFFTSVGMLLDLGFVVDRAPLVIGVAFAVILGKSSIVTAIVTWVLKRSLFTGILSGLALAQVGEFSFVLASVAGGVGLISDQIFQFFLAATIVSMLLTPLLITRGRSLANWVVQKTGNVTYEARRMAASALDALNDHTIIVGYGMSGRHLARVLKAAHLPYIVLETNGQTVRAARHQRESIVFGDGTRREVLLRAGVHRAKVVVFNISSPAEERRGTAVARELNRDVKVLVRTRTVDTIADLKSVGASDVIVEEYEAALELFQRVLFHYHIPVNTISAELDALRAEHYGILRGVPKEALHLNDLTFLGIHHALELVLIEQGARAVGGTPSSINLREATGATVVATVRAGVAYYEFGSDFRWQVGDTVVLVGPAPALVKGADIFKEPS